MRCGVGGGAGNNLGAEGMQHLAPVLPKLTGLAYLNLDSECPALQQRGPNPRWEEAGRREGAGGVGDGARER